MDFTSQIAARPDPTNIIELINAFRKSKVLFTLVEFGIPDLIESHGPCNVTEIASMTSKRCSTSQDVSIDGLERLLNACVGLGLLRSKEGQYSLTPESSVYLTTANPQSLTGYITHSNRLLYKLWSGLEVSIQTGRPCWAEAFGSDNSQVWKSTYTTREDMLRFLKGMHSFAALSSDAIFNAFDLSAFRNMIDLGGGTAALAVAACSFYPLLHATVVDLPGVVEISQACFMQPPYVKDPAVVSKVGWVAADFFLEQQLIPEGDLFVLSRILHDWDLPSCLSILELAHKKLHNGGALLVCELLLDEDKQGPPNTLLQSLNMLVGWKGQERTFTEYRELLQSAGFAKVEGKKTGSYLDVVIAYKN